MTFKEKHLIPLMMVSALTLSCGNNTEKEKNDNALGLLDERLMRDHDKYGNDVTLAQVKIPLYKKNGERDNECYVLARGLNKSEYLSSQKLPKLTIKPVYLNGSKKLSYVKADGNNAIYTDNGFSGLFIDTDNNAVVVADVNITRFIDDMNKSLQREFEIIKRQRITNSVIKAESDAAENINDSTSVGASSYEAPEDSLRRDSVINKNTYSKELFLDTLRNLKNNEF